MGPQGLKVVRRARKYSLRKLSEISGVPASTISNHEMGRTEMRKDSLEKLAQALEVPASELTPIPLLVRDRGETSAARQIASKTLARRPLAYAELLSDFLELLSREHLEYYFEKASAGRHYGLAGVIAAEITARGEEPEKE